MPGQDSQGRFTKLEELLVAAQVPSAARTENGTGAAFDTADLDTITGVLTVTAASGDTPTLNVMLETTADGTNFYQVSEFIQKTAPAAADAKVFGLLGSVSRWVWAVAGDTPSFTFAVSATVDRDD